MEYFLEVLVTSIMNALEEFFEAIVIPSTKFTRDAFIVSLGFLATSVVLQLADVIFFVSWKEALVCSIIMLIIVLIDSSSRQSMMSFVDKVKLHSNSKEILDMEETSDE